MPSAEIHVFPFSRLIGISRRLIDLSETLSNEEMSDIWQRQMDALEVRMVRLGFGIEARARELYGLYRLTEGEKYRRLYEGRRHEPDEAA